VRSGGRVFLETACISKMIKEGSCLRDNVPAWVLKRVKIYLDHDMVSLSFIQITMNSSEDDSLSIGDRN
jgi:hypothetical protein